MSSQIENLITGVIDCAFKVHKTLGIGFLEKVYHNSLLVELSKHDLDINSQCPIKVEYDSTIVGEYFADIIVNDILVLELKALKEVTTEHSAQLINYLKASNIKKKSTPHRWGIGSLVSAFGYATNTSSGPVIDITFLKCLKFCNVTILEFICICKDL